MGAGETQPGSKTAGVDGQTRWHVEQQGVEKILGELRQSLRDGSYAPLPVREYEIPKRGSGKVRRLGISALRDRIVQMATTLPSRSSTLESVANCRSSAARAFSACAVEGRFGLRRSVTIYAHGMPATIGEPDIARLAAAIADQRRARILLALNDGRALPASLLAREAGVAASTASEHLRRLVEAGLVSVHRQGRHRYFRLAGAEVGALLESLSALAPTIEVRSLKQGTRAEALRRGRTCYDHLAGHLGVSVFTSLLAAEAIVGGDGVHRLEGANADRLSAPGRDLAYCLTRDGRKRLLALGLALPAPEADGTTPLRYCVDWTEQRHHLSGVVGRALADRLFERAWLERLNGSRAVRLTTDGIQGLRRAFGVDLPE